MSVGYGVSLITAFLQSKTSPMSSVRLSLETTTVRMVPENNPREF